MGSQLHGGVASMTVVLEWKDTVVSLNFCRLAAGLYILVVWKHIFSE